MLNFNVTCPDLLDSVFSVTVMSGYMNEGVAGVVLFIWNNVMLLLLVRERSTEIDRHPTAFEMLHSTCPRLYNLRAAGLAPRVTVNRG